MKLVYFDNAATSWPKPEAMIQTAGSVPIQVESLGIDILFFTGHKSLYGPQGTGGMYLRKGLETLIEPLERGGTGSRSEFEEQPAFMPDRFESGTPNTIGIAGLGAGVRHVMETGIESIRGKEIELSGLFMEGLLAIDGVTVCGHRDPTKKTAVTSFIVEGMETSDISFALDERFGIMTRPGLHCSPSAHRTIGTFPGGTVRCSYGMFTTEDEIHAAIRAIEMLISEKK